MGRPFIIHDSNGADSSQPANSQPDNDSWVEDARKCLAESGFDLEDQEVSAIFDYLLAQRKHAFLPICAPSPSSGLGLLCSKVGGLPYLLPSESWPTNNGTSLSHLWQQLVSELPPPVQDALGYTRGLLQVFVSDSLPVDTEGNEWFLVRVLPDDQLMPRSPADIALGPGVQLKQEQVVTGFRAEVDCPHVEDLLDGLPADLSRTLVEDVVQALQDNELYETVTGDKLLGWPNWCQGPEWRSTQHGERCLQLLQIEGDVVPFIVGDSGTLLLQRHPQDKDEWNGCWACC